MDSDKRFLRTQEMPTLYLGVYLLGRRVRLGNQKAQRRGPKGTNKKKQWAVPAAIRKANVLAMTIPFTHARMRFYIRVRRLIRTRKSALGELTTTESCRPFYLPGARSSRERPIEKWAHDCPYQHFPRHPSPFRQQ